MSMLDYRLPNSRPDDRMALTERQLLQSVVEMARNVFDAAASSVFLIDSDTGELVFEAVTGAGEDHLPGARFAPGTGIVGWVAGSVQPIFVEDLSSNETFSRAAAESTGYVPSSLMAAPLVQDGDCIGVLEILDPVTREGAQLGDLTLLALLGTQAAISLKLLVAARQVSLSSPEGAVLARIGERMRTADPATAALVSRTLAMADDLLGASRG